MRTPVLLTAAAGGLAAALTLGAAVPALASGSAPVSTTEAIAATDAERAPLSADELARIESFYAHHPVLGHRLLARIEAWTDFLADHPALAAELERLRALPAEQRRAEVVAWLAAHPVVRADLRELRADRRDLRRDLRELRRDLRP